MAETPERDGGAATQESYAAGGGMATKRRGFTTEAQWTQRKRRE
jgi:hypothetical protein